MGPASVAIVENHATVTVEVLGPAERDPDRPGFYRVQARVLSAEGVEHWPNLFERDIGSEVTFYVPEAMVEEFGLGARVRFRAKKTGLGVGFAEAV